MEKVLIKRTYVLCVLQIRTYRYRHLKPLFSTIDFTSFPRRMLDQNYTMASRTKNVDCPDCPGCPVLSECPGQQKYRLSRTLGHSKFARGVEKTKSGKCPTVATKVSFSLETGVSFFFYCLAHRNRTLREKR